MTLHPLLRKQLERAGVEIEGTSAACQELLLRVSRTYQDADDGRYRLERSIAISAEEMSELTHSLASERDRLRAVFDSAAVGITQADMDGVLLECNEAYAKMVGRRREEVVGHRWIEFVHPDEAGQTWARNSHALEQPLTFERRYVHQDGRTIWATVTVSTVHDANKAPIANIAVQRDITAQRELEVSLRHAQKLEAVGRLAAGVAHEINTPLQFVGDNLEFLDKAFESLTTLYARVRPMVGPEHTREVERLEEELDCAFICAESRSAVATSIEGLHHVAHIVRAMKVLARHDEAADARLVDVNGMLESVLTLVRTETKYVADVTFERGDIPPVLGFAEDLSQVFVNLLVNAAHAVGDVVKGTSERGSVRVRTFLVGKDVVVAVEDTGCGIPENIRSRVFEAFFTTKEPGRGTGQGLSLARAIIVDKHHGELTFESEVGRGTTFYVRLRPPERAESAA